MGFRAGFKYIGTIREGSNAFESQRGTPGFQVMLRCEDGDTDFVIWLTERNRENAARYFQTIGADMSRLENENYIQYELPAAIVGVPVAFSMKDETFNNETRLKCAWIGRPSTGRPEKQVATFFAQQSKGAATAPQPSRGAKAVPASVPAQDESAEDAPKSAPVDDLPF